MIDGSGMAMGAGIDGGDAVTLIGRAARSRHADKEPLIYHAGCYGTFQA